MAAMCMEASVAEQRYVSKRAGGPEALIEELRRLTL
jgi:hypothetical protein